MAVSEQEKGRPSRLVVFLTTLYKQHWHVELTHFPITLFFASAVFAFLAIITDQYFSAFLRASYVTLGLGALFMWPTTWTGWRTWKKWYKGAHVKLFLYKIRTSFAMVLISTFLTAWRTIVPDYYNTAWYWMYGAGIILLLLGAAIEGHYGGKLHHR